MEINEKNNNLQAFQKKVKQELDRLTPVFARAAIGDFSKNVPIPEGENEFSELYVGVQVMLEVIREKISELEELNGNLAEKVSERTRDLEEAQYLTHIGSWEWDIKKNAISWSDEMYRIYGLKPGEKEIDFETYLSLIHPKDKELVSKEIEEACSNSMPFNFFHKILRKDKTVRILHCRGKVETDKEGNPLRMIGTGQDITEMKIAEEELIKSHNKLEETVKRRTAKLEDVLGKLNLEIESKKLAEEKAGKLAAIVKTSHDVIIGKTLRGEITSWNPAAEKLYGYKSKEVIGKDISIIVPKDKRKELKTIMKKLNAGEPIKHFETVRKHKNGHLVYVSLTISPIKDQSGEVLGASSIAKDITEQREHQLALDESEKKYKTLVETMDEGVLVVDLDDKITFTNSTFRKRFGYKQKELQGKKAMDLLLDKKDRKKMKKIMADRKKGRHSQYEIQMKTKSEKKLWMLVNGSPMYDHDGNVSGSVGLHTNITDRKIYEDKLDALAKFPASNPNPVLRFSIHGQVLIYQNKAAKQFVKHFDDKKGIREKWITLINNVYKKGEVVEEELHLDGRTYLFAMVPVTEGKYINLYGTDITDARKAEEEIKRLLLVLSKTDNAIVIADVGGNIQWVNKAFEKISGYTLNEVKGTHGEKLRHGKSTGLNTEHPLFNKMIQTKKSVSYESKNYSKNGKKYWSLTTLTPVLNEEGKIEGIVAIDADLTEKKKAEKAMIKAKRMAEDSAKSKELFLANMSHEIRTPMNAIMGIIQLLEETSLTEQQKNYLKSMDFASENLLRIINDVLDLSKVESGKLSIECINFNIRDILNDLINSMNHRAGEKNIELNLSVQNGIPDFLLGDPVRVNQILINLVSNAIKFTDKGSVSVSVEKKKSSNEEYHLRFVVSDTGIGIPKKLQKQIFKEFEQAHKETTRKYGGTGLGLSIVKKLTELQNGEMNLESKEGKGSTFTIELPFEKVKTEKRKDDLQTTVENNGQLKDKHVLLVEDNKLNQMVAERFLQSMGLDVEIVEDGKKAVEAFEKNDYDAVLMDIQMPRMNGYQATTHIREEIGSDVPIMAMTAHALKEEKEKCIKAGMNDYMTKPLDKERLFEKIVRLIK